MAKSDDGSERYSRSAECLFVPPDRRVSDAVVRRVAELEQVDVLRLPPLYRAVDPDALDRLIDSLEAGADRAAGRLRFRYCGYEITVVSDRSVALRSLDETD